LLLLTMAPALLVVVDVDAYSWINVPAVPGGSVVSSSFAVSQQQQLARTGRSSSRMTTSTSTKTAAFLVRSGRTPPTSSSTVVLNAGGGNLHGENACFLPLIQLDMDYFAPRIIRIAGSYPGLTRNDYESVASTPPPDQGQWMYEFFDSDSDDGGHHVGMVAIEGSAVVYNCDDPIVVIAEHTSMGVQLPPAITEPVDLVVLVDRSKRTFAERKFFVLDMGDGSISIGAYASKSELPSNSEIIGRIEYVQIPWLPAMKPTKTGFMEEDEYF